MKSTLTIGILAAASATVAIPHISTDPRGLHSADVHTGANSSAPNSTAWEGEYCPEGFFAGAAIGAEDHTTYQSGIANNASNHTATHQTCIKCPPGQTSNGGGATECFTDAFAWTTCTHMGCKLIETDHCAMHTSANPYADLTGSSHTVSGQKNCTSRPEKRVAVFHHGHEHAGTMHKCKLNHDSSVADADRDCECECRSTTTDYPTPFPTAYPTAAPTEAPTDYPTAAPTDSPTAPAYPTAAPIVPSAGVCTAVVAAANAPEGTCVGGTGGCTLTDTLVGVGDKFDASEVCQGESAAPDYVIKYSNPTSSAISYKVDTCDASTNFDITLAIYTVTGAQCAQIACNDDASDPDKGSCSVGTASLSAFIGHSTVGAIPANSDVYVVVSAYSVQGGTFKVTIEEV